MMTFKAELWLGAINIVGCMAVQDRSNAMVTSRLDEENCMGYI